MNTVKVRLRKPTRVFTFLCSDIDLVRDDPCVVRSDRGLEYGICVLPPEPCPAGMEDRYKMRVVRKTTPTDEIDFLKIQEEEQRAKASCASKISERKLAMKLVDVEFTLDKNKVTFYFTADDRIDFRQLVRDLAQELKARIELRHIQVRDEAKIVGGIGVCGRELCCSTWLGDFKPISMKMAKRQNLSLNPSKISGQCGRLLCCLSYENEMYKHRRMRERQEQEAEAAAAASNDTTDDDDPTEDEVVDVTADESVENTAPVATTGARPQAPAPAEIPKAPVLTTREALKEERAEAPAPKAEPQGAGEPVSGTTATVEPTQSDTPAAATGDKKPKPGGKGKNRKRGRRKRKRGGK